MQIVHIDYAMEVLTLSPTFRFEAQPRNWVVLPALAKHSCVIKTAKFLPVIFLNPRRTHVKMLRDNFPTRRITRTHTAIIGAAPSTLSQIIHWMQKLYFDIKYPGCDLCLFELTIAFIRKQI